jgi:hypothetical protein
VEEWRAVEAWVEVNLVPVRLMDEALLADHVDALVHEELREEIRTWFFFWEPELRLRIRWRDPEQAAAHRRTLAERLDRWMAEGTIEEWYEGAHGSRGERYVGEAEHYGEEVWQRIQDDWMNGSELALALIKLDRAGRLARTRDYHWHRHVHLFTNQLFGSWEAEIELCLRQAIAYSKLRESPPTSEAKKLMAELHDFLRG